MMKKSRIELIFLAMSVLRNAIYKRMLQNYRIFRYGHFSAKSLYNNIITVESHEEVKVLCSLSKLLELAGDRCRICSCCCSSISHWVVGCTLVIKCLCEVGHMFSWESSTTICNTGNSEMFWNNLVFDASILLSGNSFYKALQLCKIFNLSCIAPTTYFLYQRLATIKRFYEQSQVQFLSTSVNVNCISFCF